MLLSTDQLYQYGAEAGFSGGPLETIVAIALRESGGDTTALNFNPKAGCNAPSSYDRGVLQFNDTCWPQYSSADPNSCAYDPACAFKAAWVASKGGTDFTIWATYNQGIAQVPQAGQPLLGATFANPVVGAAKKAAGTLGLGFLGDPIGYLRQAFLTPFENAGIFILGVVVVLGGMLILSGSARNVSVNLAQQNPTIAKASAKAAELTA